MKKQRARRAPDEVHEPLARHYRIFRTPTGHDVAFVVDCRGNHEGFGVLHDASAKHFDGHFIDASMECWAEEYYGETVSMAGSLVLKFAFVCQVDYLSAQWFSRSVYDVFKKCVLLEIPQSDGYYRILSHHTNALIFCQQSARSVLESE